MSECYFCGRKCDEGRRHGKLIMKSIERRAKAVGIELAVLVVAEIIKDECKKRKVVGVGRDEN